MPASVESSRPIMAPSVGASNRYSTYSMQAPSLTGTIQTTDSTVADIRTIASGLERMENPALSSQRVSLSEQKTEDMKKLALGAKLDRALERRMTGQDAVMRPRTKSLDEKKMEGEEEPNSAESSANGSNADEKSQGEAKPTPTRASQSQDTEQTAATNSPAENSKKEESSSLEASRDSEYVATARV